MSVAKIENSVITEEGGPGSRIEVLHISDINGVFTGGDPPSDALIKSIKKKGGVINLPTVRYLGPGQYEAVDGRRRLRALHQLGHETAEVVVNPAIDATAAGGASLVSNYLRSDNVLQAARVVWGRMAMGETEKEIAEEDGIKVEIIRGLRDMKKLRPELIEAVEKGVMKPWAARMAARHDPDTVQQELVDRYHKNGRVTEKDVREVRSVGRKDAIAEVADLFDDLPENETPDSGANDDDDTSVVAWENQKPKPKVKIARQERLENVQAYIGAARREVLAIKSNNRSQLETNLLATLNEILEQLQNPDE